MTVSLLDAAYALLVAGAAMIWPPLALIVAGAFLAATWWINDRRAAAAQPEGAKP
jgi:hypothetical protein